MGRCQRIQMDCVYTDRDNNDACSLGTCKYNIILEYNPDGTFTTKPIKIRNTSTKNTTDTKNTKKKVITDGK